MRTSGWPGLVPGIPPELVHGDLFQQLHARLWGFLRVQGFRTDVLAGGSVARGLMQSSGVRWETCICWPVRSINQWVIFK